ncbi:MAG: hypothetical protein PSN35_06310, partial [Candidatus Thioglobus sp.]|uniref:hypothetical protein n=1 Tax=Candidatus Thioglobus sp. TaxID=2026721 RepID=UPI00261E1FB8
TLPHDKLKTHLKELIHKAFSHRKDGSTFVVLGYNSTYFSNIIQKGKTCYPEEQVISMMEFLIDNIFLPLIYPLELEIKETTDTASSASFLDLYLEFDDSGQLSTNIYDKRDDFNFKIINYPNMCSNIPASPAYGVYISQLIRYARASSNYSDFLRNRLLDQGYKQIRLIRSLKKFIFRYQDLVEVYSASAEIIVKDGFS